MISSKITKRTTSTVELVAAEARAMDKLPPRMANRARVDRTQVSYNIVPRQTAIQESRFARPLGASGEDRFRKMQARQNAASKASRR